MAVNWQWNNYILMANGDALRCFAKEHGIFIYPYDIQTGSDIAMFEGMKVKDPKQRFIVCGIDDMREKTISGITSYEISTWGRVGDWDNYCSESYEGAIELWNKRMKETAQQLLKPPLRRFWLNEYSAIFMNLLLWGFIFFIVSLNNNVFFFFRDHYIFTLSIFILLCSNVKNIFLKSYGEEIPRDMLQKWAYANIYGYDEKFCDDAIRQWAMLKERHDNSVPLYLLWKRGKLRAAKDDETPKEIESHDEPQEMTYKLYCREILDSLRIQIDEISDLRTKIFDKTVKGYVENILKILREIQQTISAEDAYQKIISARRVVSYWNEETISLLQNYTKLLNNSSDEAAETKNGIEEILKDLPQVYKKELGHITETSTIEIKASISVIRNEIDQVLNERI